jgi:uncharacterized protein (TIGR02996 family)
MSHSAFLQAIASEPADDTARLVYADFLEESGEAVHIARAEFIRTQIQASALHPNTLRRAELEHRATELFSAHWLDWLAPLCETVGLPLPHIPSSGFRARFNRFLGRQQLPPGHPYELTDSTTLGLSTRRPPPPPDTPLRSIAFARGFPQWVRLLGRLTDIVPALRLWGNVAPLAALHLQGTVPGDWKAIDGPHLRGVRELTLRHATTDVIRAVAGSADVPRLDDLTLLPDRSNADWPAEQYRGFANSSLVKRVKWLRVVIGTPYEAVALANAHLVNLCGLDVQGPPVAGSYSQTVHSGGLAVCDLLASPHLVGLKELKLTGTAVLVLSRLPDCAAKGLRRLAFAANELAEGFTSVLRRDALSNLTDLSIALGDHAARPDLPTLCAALADSPLAGRLRHLRLTGYWAPGSVSAGELLRLIRALNPETLETLVLDSAAQETPEVWAELQTRFAGKVRLVWCDTDY